MTEKVKLTDHQESVERHAGRISRERVLAATSELPDRQREAVRWLHSYALENRLNLKSLAEKLRCSDSSLSQLFSGKYPASLDNFVQEIESFRKLVGQRSAVTKVSFIKTELSDRIFQCCEAALIYQRIMFIFGASQIGKTRALEQYAERSQDVVYVRMPEGGILGDFLYELAQALKISTEHNTAQLKRRIKAAFDDRMVLIVDELHQVFMTKGGSSRLRSIEFIRELYDRCRCGVVLSGTNIFRDEIQHGRHKQILEQLDLRGLASLQLPDRPSAEDLNAFATAYGLLPASGQAAALQDKIIKEHRLSRWLTVLQAASRLAQKKKETMDWQHVLTAHAGLESLSKLKTKGTA